MRHVRTAKLIDTLERQAAMIPKGLRAAKNTGPWGKRAAHRKHGSHLKCTAIPHTYKPSPAIKHSVAATGAVHLPLAAPLVAYLLGPCKAAAHAAPSLFVLKPLQATVALSGSATITSICRSSHCLGLANETLFWRVGWTQYCINVKQYSGQQQGK